MRVNIKEFLEDSGIQEPFYPGKRLVHSCRQPGEFKSHCVVFDWRDPAKIRIEVKAGLSGKDLDFKHLRYYPVSFQSPTYMDLEIVNDNKEKDESEDGEQGSSSGGDSRGHGKKKDLASMKSLASQAFGSVMKGDIPAAAVVAEMVVMGMKIAKDAYEAVLDKFAQQISHAKIQATDILAQAGDFVTKYTPPAFLKPTGDEQKVYKYDRVKNADIGYRPGSM